MYLFNLSLMFFISLTYLFLMLSINPLLMGVSIIIQSMIHAMMISFFFNFSWFSFILFIVYLGGILMLFSYIISMISIEKMNMLNLTTMKMMSVLSFVIAMSFLMINKNNFKELLIFKKLSYSMMLASIFSNSYNLSIFMLIFLLFVMIVVVFLVENSKGSMRSI
nr:NADH dehydrogenase subunit 6 [Aptinothrips stylifer]